MYNKHQNYGIHYGELVPVFNNVEKIERIYFDGSLLTTHADKLLEMGVVEAFLDVEDEGNSHVDTLFFKIDENTKVKDLMVWVVNLRPNEFSEESPNHFRMWFD